MRRFLLSSSSSPSWCLCLHKISPNLPRFYCSSSPSISTTPDFVDPKFPDSDSDSNVCIPHTVTDSTTEDEIYSDFVDPKFPDSDSNVCIPHTVTGSTTEDEIYFASKDIGKADPDSLFDRVNSAKSITISIMFSKHSPDLALASYREFQEEGQPDWLPKNPLMFCVLLHILATASEYHSLIIKWLDSYVSSDSCPPGISLYLLLLKVESFERMAKDFKFRPWVYSTLLTAYARADRCSDAIDCLNAMLTNDILPNSDAINALLRLLIWKGMIFEAKKLYADIVSKGVFYDCETVRMMMNLSLQQGNVEESQRYFLDAIGHPPVQYAMCFNYTNAIDFACNKLESEGACALLCQMISLGVTPPEDTYTNVIRTCVNKGKIDLAIMANQELRNSGLSLKTSVLTSLMKGFNLQGDLSSALELFDKMSEFGLCPDRDTYAAIIEGCVNHGNIDKAVELNNQMKLAGIPLSGEIVHSLIKGFFKAGMHDEALKLLDEARKVGVANTFTNEDVLGWFRKEGSTDESHCKPENSAEKGTAACTQ